MGLHSSKQKQQSVWARWIKDADGKPVNGNDMFMDMMRDFIEVKPKYTSDAPWIMSLHQLAAAYHSYMINVRKLTIDGLFPYCDFVFAGVKVFMESHPEVSMFGYKTGFCDDRDFQSIMISGIRLKGVPITDAGNNVKNNGDWKIEHCVAMTPKNERSL